MSMQEGRKEGRMAGRQAGRMAMKKGMQPVENSGNWHVTHNLSQLLRHISQAVAQRAGGTLDGKIVGHNAVAARQVSGGLGVHDHGVGHRVVHSFHFGDRRHELQVFCAHTYHRPFTQVHAQATHRCLGCAAKGGFKWSNGVQRYNNNGKGGGDGECGLFSECVLLLPPPPPSPPHT
jgi:hypothetical protein